MRPGRPLEREAGGGSPAQAVPSSTGAPPGPPHVPIRMCVGCRQRAAARSLLRVVAQDGELIPDPNRRLPGRGANVHPTSKCVETATAKKAWARALRVPGPLGTAAVLAHLALSESTQPPDRESR